MTKPIEDDDEDMDYTINEEEFEYKMPGRPPKNPLDILRTAIRCLITKRVNTAVKKGMKIHGVNQSNYMRLALYNQFRLDGLLDTPEMLNDATWDELKRDGQV